MASALVFLVMLVLGASGASDPAVDGLERRLEMARHVRLMKVKNDPASSLAAFTTDGCSGGMSVGWEYFARQVPAFAKRHGNSPPWEDCCVAHDRLYHQAGGRGLSAWESFEARKSADQGLKVCVANTSVSRLAELNRDYGLSEQEIKTLYKVIADLIYSAVRAGGMPCTGLSWRWGYGWPECSR